MLVEQAVLKIATDATANAKAAALVALIDQRLYAGILPSQVQYPAIAYRVVPPRQTIKKLDPPGESELVKVRFRFFSTAETPSGYGLACQVSTALRTALKGFAGTVIDATVSPADSMIVSGIFTYDNSGFDFYDDPTQTWQRVSEFDVWAHE